MGPNEWSAATFWDLNASALLQIGGITKRRSGKCFIVAHNTKKKKKRNISRWARWRNTENRISEQSSIFCQDHSGSLHTNAIAKGIEPLLPAS